MLLKLHLSISSFHPQNSGWKGRSPIGWGPPSLFSIFSVATSDTSSSNSGDHQDLILPSDSMMISILVSKALRLLLSLNWSLHFSVGDFTESFLKRLSRSQALSVFETFGFNLCLAFCSYRDDDFFSYSHSSLPFLEFCQREFDCSIFLLLFFDGPAEFLRTPFDDCLGIALFQSILER